MARIPTYESQVRLQTSSTAPTIKTPQTRMEGLTGSGQMFQRAGEDVSQMGRKMVKLAEERALKMRDIHNKTQAMQTSTDLYRKVKGLQFQAQGEQDYLKADEYNEELQKTYQESLAKIDDPEQRMIFQQKYDKNIINAEYEMRSGFRKKRIDHSVAVLNDHNDEMINAYYDTPSPVDRSKAVLEIQNGLRGAAQEGTISYEEAEKELTELPDKLMLGQIRKGIDEGFQSPEALQAVEDNINSGLYNYTDPVTGETTELPEEDKKGFLTEIQSFKKKAKAKTKERIEIERMQRGAETVEGIENGQITLADVNRNEAMGLYESSKEASAYRRMFTETKDKASKTDPNSYLELQDILQEANTTNSFYEVSEKTKEYYANGRIGKSDMKYFLNQAVVAEGIESEKKSAGKKAKDKGWFNVGWGVDGNIKQLRKWADGNIDDSELKDQVQYDLSRQYALLTDDPKMKKEEKNEIYRGLILEAEQGKFPSLAKYPKDKQPTAIVNAQIPIQPLQTTETKLKPDVTINKEDPDPLGLGF